jgi:hypothetical protein
MELDIEQTIVTERRMFRYLRISTMNLNRLFKATDLLHIFLVRRLHIIIVAATHFHRNITISAWDTTSYLYTH